MIRVKTGSDKVFAVVDDDEASMIVVRELPVPSNGPDSPELSVLKESMIKYDMCLVGGCVIESWSSPDA